MDVISDEFWSVVELVMPSHEGKRGNRFGDHRMILEAIAWRFRTGSLNRPGFHAPSGFCDPAGLPVTSWE